MIEPGSIVYAKAVRTSAGKNFVEYKMKNPVICYALGVALPKAPPLTLEFGFKLLAATGMIRTDDIAEALGEKSFQKLSLFLRKKYGDLS